MGWRHTEDWSMKPSTTLTVEEYNDRICTMAFDLLLLKLEIEEKDKEISSLMRDKIELACELAQVNS